jgi:hypothetical protein
MRALRLPSFTGFKRQLAEYRVMRQRRRRSIQPWNNESSATA